MFWWIRFRMFFSAVMRSILAVMRSVLAVIYGLFMPVYIVGKCVKV